MLIVSGYNVYPSHIENVLLEHPAILNCGVVGIPHPYKMHVPKAFIVLRHGFHGLFIKNEIKEYCKKFGNRLDLISRGVSLCITRKTPQGARTIHIACFEFENGKIYAIDNDKNHTKFDLGTAEEIINSNYDLGLVILRELDKLLSTVITD